MAITNIFDRPFAAVLCDLDNVIRFYDLTRLAQLEQAGGLAVGTTTRVAYAPEIDVPLLLGKISKEEWVEAIVLGLAGEVSEPEARELGTALAEAPFWADDVVVTMLRRMREHMPLVLVTNATLELESDLELLGLSDLADHVVSSARVGVVKPESCWDYPTWQTMSSAAPGSEWSSPTAKSMKSLPSERRPTLSGVSSSTTGWITSRLLSPWG